MTREVVHIGFPKTATTTLQEHLFGPHAGITNLARPFPDRKREALCTALALADDSEFDEKELSAAVATSRSGAPKLLVYSDETVVNSPIRSIAAKRLQKLLPDARVLAIIRNQLDAFASYYAAHGRKLRPAPEPYSGRHVSFENYLAFNYENPKRGFLPTLRYDAILDLYQGVFGSENIDILVYEEFQRDRHAFMAKLSAILDIETEDAVRMVSGGHERARPKESAVRYDALRSRFLRGVPLSRIVPGSARLKKIVVGALGNETLDVTYPRDWERKIADMFRDGNRRLRDQHGLPLERFGYPL